MEADGLLHHLRMLRQPVAAAAQLPGQLHQVRRIPVRQRLAHQRPQVLRSLPLRRAGRQSDRRTWAGTAKPLPTCPPALSSTNGIRAIGYLASRSDVDAHRIVTTGLSGGGATTFWLAAADERVRCAVPASGLTDWESNVVQEKDGKIRYKTEDGKQWRVTYSKQADGTYEYAMPE